MGSPHIKPGTVYNCLTSWNIVYPSTSPPDPHLVVWRMVGIVVFTLFLVALTTDGKSYEGYKLISVETHTDAQISYLAQLQSTTAINIWKWRNGVVEIICSPEEYNELYPDLMSQNM